MTPHPVSFHVALLAFDGMEALDFAGPFEVFTTAARVHARQAPPAQPPLFSVGCVARSGGPVQARAGLRVLPDTDFANTPAADLLLVPGGVVDEPMACADTLAWVRQLHAGSRCTASVCTGAFVLAAAGVLTDQAVTTHWEDLTDLQQRFPALRVRGGVRWVEATTPQGPVVTSAGIAAGIDMALHLVATLSDGPGRPPGLHGAELARLTARQMDYPWPPTHTTPDPAA